MSNYFRTGIMRRMREYTAAVEQNLARRDKEIADYENAKGSKLYEDAVKSINADTKARKERLFEGVRMDLMTTLAKMRAEVVGKTTKAPTTDMVNTLALLDALDSITLTQAKMYAETMADYPLAIQKLSQIAKKHDITIRYSSPDALSDGIDRLEGYLTEYLRNFNGDVTACPSFAVKKLYRFFQPEDYYAQGVKMDNSTLARTFHTSEEIDNLLWAELVGVGTPETVENATDGKKAPVVQYFFNSVEALSDFIDKSCNCMDEKMAENVTRDILAACPDEYAEAYKEFTTTGEKIDINIQSSEKESEV